MFYILHFANSYTVNGSSQYSLSFTLVATSFNRAGSLLLFSRPY